LCAAAHNTYVKTWQGWAYLATVIDLYSRKVVGYAVADHMRTDLITDALDMAIAASHPSPGVIFHSDRGTSVHLGTVRPVLHEEQHSAFTRKDRYLPVNDNAVSESFFATYKKELIHTRPWPTSELPLGSHRRMDQELLQYR
jgi:putative transposase